MDYVAAEALAESLSRHLDNQPGFFRGVQDAMRGAKEEIVTEVADSIGAAITEALDERLAKFVSEAVVARLTGVDASQLRIVLAGILQICLTVPPTERSYRALHAALSEIVNRCHRAGVLE